MPVKVEYFESGTQTFGPDSSEVSFYIEGPSVASVAWIPRFSFLRYFQMPGNAYRDHASFRMRNVGFPTLFWTGNPPPDLYVDQNREGLSKFLSKKEFRGALALDGIKLYCDSYAEPVRVSFSAAGEVGFTPVRALGHTIYSPGVLGQSSGQWQPFRLLNYPQRGVSTRGFIVFKVGKVGDWASKMSTGRWLPYVRLDIEYTLRTDGFFIVKFDGSFIPSQQNYGNWSPSQCHDMLENDATAVNSFFESGLKENFWAEKDVAVAPPRRVIDTWTGNAPRFPSMSAGGSL
jgi:hypothetical protein